MKILIIAYFYLFQVIDNKESIILWFYNFEKN